MLNYENAIEYKPSSFKIDTSYDFHPLALKAKSQPKVFKKSHGMKLLKTEPLTATGAM